ncbi:hypothetical protein BGW38_009844 [Lunasporangiospora selenospora]|uniref:Arrestin-like N-terminal domain-containing protein n=1 Tax=Lunasporangiospora selenospora TaxID=979761 RepID=A0A9P6FZ07_9FUNG|nr:hypothetical protein BGW38_009844 [Lunasporangiospora selenospora]
MFNLLKKSEPSKPKTLLTLQVYTGQTQEHPKGGSVPLIYSSFDIPATLQASVTLETEQELKAHDVELVFRAEAVAMLPSVSTGFYSNAVAPFESVPHYYMRKRWTVLGSAPRVKPGRIVPGTYSKATTTHIDSAWPSSWYSERGFVRYIFEASVVKMKFGEVYRTDMVSQEIWVVNTTWIHEPYSLGASPSLPLETVQGVRVEGLRSKLSGLTTTKKAVLLPTVSMSMPGMLSFGGQVSVLVTIDDSRRCDDVLGDKSGTEVHVESVHFVLQEEVVTKSRISTETIKIVRDKMTIAINDGWPWIQSSFLTNSASPQNGNVDEKRTKYGDSPEGSRSSSSDQSNSRKIQRTITLRLPPIPELASTFSEKYLQVTHTFKMTIKLRIGQSRETEKDRTLEEFQAKMNVSITGPRLEGGSQNNEMTEVLPQYSASGSTL